MVAEPGGMGLRSTARCSIAGATISTMERIGVRELRQHASRYLDRVKAGESIEVYYEIIDFVRAHGVNKTASKKPAGVA